ncbi:MAG: alpha/beta hydrolase [Lysobacterales bacterium]|nr:MAG: alpha/beta hydrolase [Xanthomonadales bacterium]
MHRTVGKWLGRGGLLAAGALVAVLAVRAWDARSGPELEQWHTFVPDELDHDELERSEWKDYLAVEERIFAEVREEVTERLDPEDRLLSNRYFAGSPIYPGRFEYDWNRSYVLEPDGPPVGAVVLLHGLTDSPYSLRHIARRYRELGFVAVAIRLPAHGTVPAALADIEWEDWLEATRLAVREARRRAGPDAPLHLVGFSNGGALAMKYALDALGDPSLDRPARIVLISPMIGITAFARFAGVFGWPAVLPAFAKASWLGVVPEFNPFKYNSFPVNGARQSSLLTRSLQEQIARYAQEGRLLDLPPVLTFQSVVDFTVSTRAIVRSLYAHLPENGSELVLFDFNRNARFGPLLRSTTETVLSRILPAPPRRYRTTIVTNAGRADYTVIARVLDAGATVTVDRPLGLAFPAGVYSLSHVALPFPLNDSLYGLEPETEEFGVNLGAMALRGERGILVVSLDSLVRVSSNPFYPWLLGRIEEGIAADVPGIELAPVPAAEPASPAEATAQRRGAPEGVTTTGSTRNAFMASRSAGSSVPEAERSLTRLVR